MTRAAYESGRDVVHLLDSSNRKLAVYTCDGRSLTLLHVRDLRADIVPVEYNGGPPQSPPVRTMAEHVKPAAPPATPPAPAPATPAPPDPNS